MQHVEHQLPLSFASAIVPDGFVVNQTGTYRIIQDELVQIATGPCYVTALGREPSGTRWTVRIHVITADGDEHVLETPFTGLSGAALASLITTIAEKGVLALSDRHLRDYLSRCAAQRDLPRLTLISRLGFFDLPNGSTGFALPGQFIIPTDAQQNATETLAFRARNNSPAMAAYSSSGSLGAWQGVVEQLRWSPLHVFSVCAGLAGPFLTLAGMEGGGVNLYGTSSSGKTTALQLAASVWGRGADPQRNSDESTLMERWNATRNAFELLASAHSGMLLLLDELGSGVDQDIYNLIGGKGKTRMTESGQAQETRRWTIFLMSCGESSMQAHIESTQRRRWRTGESIRVLDVPVDALPESVPVSPEEKRLSVEAAKEACGRVYGSAGPAFVQALFDELSPDELLQELADQINASWEQLLAEAEAAGRPLLAPQKRALERIALVKVIGQWACETGILPYSVEEVVDAVRAIRDAWLNGQSTLSEGERAIQVLRDFAMAYSGQFLIAEDYEQEPGRSRPPIVRGFVHKDKLLLTDDQLAFALAGLPSGPALDALHAAGVLHQTEERNRKSKHTITCLRIKNQRFYTLRLHRLLADEHGRDADVDESGPGQAAAAGNVTDLSSCQPRRRNKSAGSAGISGLRSALP